MKQGN